MCINLSALLAATLLMSADREERLYPMETNAVVTVAVMENAHTSLFRRQPL